MLRMRRSRQSRSMPLAYLPGGLVVSAARFKSLGIDIRPIDLDPRYGGILGSIVYPTPESDPSADVDVEGNGAGTGLIQRRSISSSTMEGPLPRLRRRSRVP